MEPIAFTSTANRFQAAVFSPFHLSTAAFQSSITTRPRARYLPCKCSSLALDKPSLTTAHQLFGGMPSSDTFAWNNLIQTYLTNKDSSQVTFIYEQMLQLGVKPDRHTLPRVLAASRLLGDLPFGKQLHCHVVKLGHASDAYVTSALIELYGQLEGVHAAELYFNSVSYDKSNDVAWTLLARMYVKNNNPQSALDLFYEITGRSGKVGDAVALATIISACGMLRSLRDGRHVHRIARDYGLECNVLVGNSLLQMYVDCGSIKDARWVFDGMVDKDAISWTAMVNGYVKRGEFNEGLKLFRLMNMKEIKADVVAIASVLPACARVAAYKNGREIHGNLIRNGIELNTAVLNALVDMYVKSGSVEYASRIFSGMKNKDVISWTVMISGYSMHGQGELGVKLFREVVESSTLEVDQKLLASVLYACYSAGMLEEGKHYFDRIKAPKVEHCALMVALLARCGFFDEANKLITERNISGHGEVLKALLDGCRRHKKLNEGKRIIEQLCVLEPLNAENHVMLSNWFAQHGNWDMVDKLKETTKDLNLRPLNKAYSWIEFRNKIHVFGTGDVSHPRSESIHWKLHELMRKIEDEGLVVKSDFSLYDVHEEKDCSVTEHSLTEDAIGEKMQKLRKKWRNFDRQDKDDFSLPMVDDSRPMEYEEQEELVRSFERMQAQQSLLWRGVFSGLLLCYMMFLLYSIYQQAYFPWELRYHAYFMYEIDSWMVLTADCVALSVCLMAILGMQLNSQQHQQHRQWIWYSFFVGLLLAVFWLYHMLRLSKFRWDVIWLPVAPLSGAGLCLYVDSLLSEPSEEIRKLRGYMYSYKGH